MQFLLRGLHFIPSTRKNGTNGFSEGLNYFYSFVHDIHTPQDQRPLQILFAAYDAWVLLQPASSRQQDGTDLGRIPVSSLYQPCHLQVVSGSVSDTERLQRDDASRAETWQTDSHGRTSVTLRTRVSPDRPRAACSAT